MNSGVRFLVVTIVLVALVLLPELSFAQCPMCRAGAESSLREGSTAAAGLNTGIIYLFLIPYLLVMSIGGYWWYNNKKSKAAEAV